MKNNLNTNRTFVDREMVEHLLKGDFEAFAGLFHAHKARIYYICLRMTNNTVQAEDLTRDAFLQGSENCRPLKETPRYPLGSFATR